MAIMANKVLLPVLMLGGLGAVLFFATRAKAAPSPGGYVPTASDIMGATSFEELDSYYELTNELDISGQISQSQYQTLYAAYVDRWNELGAVV